jgi:phosphatidate cytidylyltransferase
MQILRFAQDDKPFSMKPRILTALLLIPPVIYLIGWSPKWLLLAAVIAVVELCLYEFYKICQHAGFKPLSALGYLAGAALCAVRAMETSRAEMYSLVLLVAFVLMTLTMALVMTRDLKTYLGAIATTTFSVVYIGLALSCLLPLRFSRLGAGWLGLAATPSFSEGRKLMLLLFLVIWADDTFAYLVGRTIGRKMLFPSISPKKTLEGSVAGLVGSLLVAWSFARLFWQTASLKIVILLAGLVALFGQIGDLVESAMKRGANLKDSGSALPGHGGLLDRVDSLLLGAPALWLTLAILDFWR